MQSIEKNILINRYHEKVKQEEITHDPDQQVVLDLLQQLYIQLQSQKKKTWLQRLIRSRGAGESTPIKGLYIWGGVGRGKTFLMNLFFQQLPQKKMRLHFHRFMQIVHEQLTIHKHQADPLEGVAHYFTQQAAVLCLDEVDITDITDAMILARLLHHLYEQQMVMVMTSNLHPKNLYKNGLQREQFLPAIELIYQYNRLVNITGALDYRGELLVHSALYYVPADALAEEKLQRLYRHLSGVKLHQERTDIIINQRSIDVRKWSDNIVWFEFDVICGVGRSTEDYLQIATFFTTVIVSNIPRMDDQRVDEVRRFINMIDVYYDNRIQLVVSAHARPESLYTTGKLVREYQRTQSRLLEMQSTQYLRP